MSERTEMKCVRCGGFSSARTCWSCSQRLDAVGYALLESYRKDRAMLVEAHRFLNAQAYTQEEMEDFCRRLNDHLGIPNDTVREQLNKLGDPCPFCSGFGIKAWHPENLCPSKEMQRQ